MGKEFAVKIWITGASGSLGQELFSKLKEAFPNTEILIPSSNSLNLQNISEVEDFVRAHKPSHIYHLAALVNRISDQMESPEKCLVLNTALDHSVFSALFKYPPKWIFYASSVAAYGYPYASKTLIERDWLKGFPHSSEYGYAMAKRHAKSYLDILHQEFGVDFSYGLITNLFGSGDRFLDGRGHVVISLLKKGLVAKQRGIPLEVWGTEHSSRDFLGTFDASALLLGLMDKHTDVVNIASGKELFISKLASEITRSLDIEAGYIFSRVDTGIDSRVCSIEKLRSFTSKTDEIDSWSLLQSMIAEFKTGNL